MQGLHDRDHRARPLTAAPWQRLPEALAALGLGVPPEAPARLVAFAERLLAANERLNLTRITAPAEVVEKHLLDALLALPLLDPLAADGPLSLADVGTGGGVPGIPLALARPSWRVTLVEATRRKAEFLEEARAALALGERVAVRCARAEELGREPDARAVLDAAVARAVGSVATVLELTLPLVRVGGRVVLYRGPSAEAAERAEAARVAPLLGGSEELTALRVALPSGAERLLLAIDKRADTPQAYPRRAGVPAKRPL